MLIAWRLLQSLARLGATVTGIDLSKDSIGAATAHSQADPQLKELLQYRACSAEDLLEQGNVACVLHAAR